VVNHLLLQTLYSTGFRSGLFGDHNVMFGSMNDIFTLIAFGGVRRRAVLLQCPLVMAVPCTDAVTLGQKPHYLPNTWLGSMGVNALQTLGVLPFPSSPPPSQVRPPTLPPPKKSMMHPLPSLPFPLPFLLPFPSPPLPLEVGPLKSI